VRLYCFPHAGATSSVFRPWRSLTPSLHTVGVDPPGRGTRAREPKTRDYRELVRSMADRVLADLPAGEGYLTFGHSFGAMVSLAVADAVARAGGEPPRRAVLSAALPPGLQPPGDETTALTDAELLDKIARDGGTPQELLSSPAMAAHLVGLMREDYAIRRQFHQDTALRVDFPLTLVAARDDGYVPVEDMWRWAEHTTAGCRRVEVDGDHFAVLRDPRELLTNVVEEAVR